MLKNNCICFYSKTHEDISKCPFNYWYKQNNLGLCKLSLPPIPEFVCCGAEIQGSINHGDKELAITLCSCATCTPVPCHEKNFETKCEKNPLEWLFSGVHM